MNASFQYNWPIGGKYVTVSLGMANIEDEKFLFRVGLVQGKDKTKVYWQGPSEWLNYEQVEDVRFAVEYGDMIVIYKKEKSTEKTSRFEWDTAKDWPAQAGGASTTHVSFTF